MELDAVELRCRIFHGGMAAVFRAGADAKVGRGLLDLDAVAHPADGGLVHAVKKRAAVDVRQLDLAVVACLGASAASAEELRHELHTVADAQHGDAQREDCRIKGRRVRVEDRGGSAGQDDAARRKGADLVERNMIGADFAVYAALAHAPRDKQIILPAEVEDEYLFRHTPSPRKTSCPASALSMTARLCSG